MKQFLPRMITQFNAQTDFLVRGITGDPDRTFDGEEVVRNMQVLIKELYADVERSVDSANMSSPACEFFIKEMSVFARFNAQFLREAAREVQGFCPELAHELLRNHLEEGGQRGKLQAHYIIYTKALYRDLGVFVNGYQPIADTTHLICWLHKIISSSHCPSTILGMYFATEAVAIAETKEIQRLTQRIAISQGLGKCPNLEFYFDMHLDENHQAATSGIAVEQGHEEGIASFIKEYQLYSFRMPQIMDGFLQMLTPLVNQWHELAYLRDRTEAHLMSD